MQARCSWIHASIHAKRGHFLQVQKSGAQVHQEGCYAQRHVQDQSPSRTFWLSPEIIPQDYDELVAFNTETSRLHSSLGAYC